MFANIKISSMKQVLRDCKFCWILVLSDSVRHGIDILYYFYIGLADPALGEGTFCLVVKHCQVKTLDFLTLLTTHISVYKFPNEILPLQSWI